MKKDVTVKYHNDLNTVNMSGWNSAEMNLLFTILARLKNNSIKTLTLNTDDLKELSQYADEHKQSWDNIMESVSNKIINLKYRYEDENVYEVMVLFSKFKVDKTNKIIEVGVTNNFEYVLNQLQANFTTYELQEFVSIKSKYAKTMYRLLKQWRTVGQKRYEINQFRLLLGIPKSYGITNITKNVIKYIELELPQYFKDLKVKPIKENRKGNPVVAYEFTWKAENVKEYNPNKYNKDKKIKPNKKHIKIPDWVDDK